MRIEYLKCGLVPILLIALVFSLVIIASPVSAGGVTSTPGGSTIEVTSDQVFLLRHELYFNQPASGGTFVMAIAWDALSSDENFTLENASAYWVSGPENGSPVENVTFGQGGTPTVWEVTATISDADKNYVDGHFNVNIWLRAASPDGTLHHPMDNHPLSYGAGIAVVEGSSLSWSTPDPITIQVIGRSVSVTISPDNQTGLPGATLNYTVTVKNTGKMGSGDYNLTVLDNENWTPTLDSYQLVNVPENGSMTTTLHVHIPDNAIGCTNDNVIVKATSQGDNTKSDNASCIAHAAMVQGVEVRISPLSQSGLGGTRLSYTVTIKNTGTGSDTYSLTENDNAGWTPSISPTSLTVPANENRTATLSVTAPENAPENTRDSITVIATSSENTAVKDNASCIAQAIASIRRGVQVSISPSSQDNENGGTLRYTVAITNTGNVTEDYNLSKTDTLGWSLTLPSPVTDVVPDENRQVTLTVGIPATAPNDTQDNVTVTATSAENTAVSDSASGVAYCVVSVAPPPPGTSSLIYVGVAAVIVVIIATVLILKPF